MLPHTVLIIDDDEMNRAILDNLFSDTYQIDEAENGRVGLTKILTDTNRYCAILLDVMMPEMDGMEVLHRLDQLNLTAKIPVFLITAEASDSTMKEAYRMGVMDVISKPIVPYIVQRRINSVVELFRARKQLNNVVKQQQSELLHQAQQIIDLNQGMIKSLATAIEFRTENLESMFSGFMTSPVFCSGAPNLAKGWRKRTSNRLHWRPSCTTSEKSQSRMPSSTNPDA